MTCDLIRGCGEDKSLTLFKSRESWIRLVGVCLRRVTEHNKLKAAQMWLWGRRADPVPQERHVWTVHNTAADQKSVLAPKPFRAFWTNRKCFRRGIKIWNMERCEQCAYWRWKRGEVLCLWDIKSLHSCWISRWQFDTCLNLEVETLCWVHNYRFTVRFLGDVLETDFDLICLSIKTYNFLLHIR